MDHAAAPSWLDSHLATRPGWADAPVDGVVVDPADADLTLPSTVAASSGLADVAGRSWLDGATIAGLDGDVAPIEVIESDLVVAGVDEPEFSIPAPAEPSLVDPFDEFVADTEATTPGDLDSPGLDDDMAPVPVEVPDHPSADDLGSTETDMIDTDMVDTDMVDTDMVDTDMVDTDMVDTDATETDMTDTVTTDAETDATGGAGYDAFDSYAGAPDAVADGVDSPDPWTPPESEHGSGDAGYDAFDDLGEGTDG